MLVTFGSEEPKRTRQPTTKLDIILKGGSTLQISANVVPQIAGSIQRWPVNVKSFKNFGLSLGPISIRHSETLYPSSCGS